jgi:YcxB-like protein
MGDPLATLTVSETSLTLTSCAGSSTVPWSAVTEIWQFPTFWLMLFSRSQFVTLPLADFTPQTKALVLDHVRASARSSLPGRGRTVARLPPDLLHQLIPGRVVVL